MRKLAKNPMSKKTQIILTTLALTLFLVQPLMAQTQEATQETEIEVGSESAESTQNLKDRIEKIVEEKTEKIKGTVDDLSKQKQGFIGEIQRVSEEAISINNSKGTKIITLTESITITKKNKQIAVENLAIGDWLIVMGYVEDDSFQAKKLIVSSISLMPKTHIVSLGTIASIKKNEVQIKDRSNADTLTLEINTKTKFEDYNGEEAKLSDFSDDLQCLVIGFEDEDDKVATTIRSLAVLDLEEETTD
jgi:hypothetical protein